MHDVVESLRNPYPWPLISDVHLREESADVVLGQVLPGLLVDCIQHGYRQVVCLGDFFHIRYRIPVSLINAVREMFIKFVNAGVILKILPGNHDQIDVGGRNALEIFGEIDGVTVFTDPRWDHDGLWVPYRHRLPDLTAALKTPKPRGEHANICWLHYGVRGAMRNNRQLDTTGAPQDLFDRFDRVFCGHYHKQQTLGTRGHIMYIGSPWQTRADEAEDPKGYVLWDGREATPVHRAWGSRFHVQRIESMDDVRSLTNNAEDTYRLTLAEGVDRTKVAQALEQRGIRKYTLTPETQVFESRLAVPDGESLEAYARAYLDQQEQDPERRQMYWQAFEEIIRGHADVPKALA